MHKHYDEVGAAMAEAEILNRIETLESSLRSEINLLKWINGLTIALVVVLYLRP